MIRLIGLFVCSSFVSLFASGGQFGPDPAYKIFRSIPYPLYSAWTSDPVYLELIGKVVIKNNPPQWQETTRYYQYTLSRNALAVEGGDFIECGVFHGKSLDIFAIVLDQWDTKNRKIYGFDSFEGLATPTIEDLDVRNGGQFFYKGAIRGASKNQIEAFLSHH
jgi:hypothetical protein